MRVETLVQFERWLRKFRDKQLRTRIISHIERFVLRGQPFGDIKHVGEGVNELRLHFGAGYRVYFKSYGNTILLLALGGDKRHQEKDIQLAKRLVREWEKEHGI